jgi:uncharacterized protein (TIGR02271 family)
MNGQAGCCPKKLMDKSDRPTPASPSDTEETLQLWKEELQVTKRRADTGGGVRIHKTVSENEHVFELTLSFDEVTVERIALNHSIESDTAPQVRYEGTKMIIPVLEEVVVIQKKFRIKEEVHVTRKVQQIRSPQSVTLRVEEVQIDRFDAPKED